MGHMDALPTRQGESRDLAPETEGGGNSPECRFKHPSTLNIKPYPANVTVDLPNVGPSALCDTNTVRLLRRVDSDRVAAMVDNGQLLFVFDVSCRAPKPGRPVCRELRFWFSEVATPQLTARLTIGEVIDRILPPSRKLFRGFEISQLLLISRVHLCYVAREIGGVIRNRTFQVTRDAFAAWLRSRWIGGGAS